jgi:hypothetical protein
VTAADTENSVRIASIFPGVVMNLTNFAIELINVGALCFGLGGFTVPRLDVKVFHFATTVVNSLLFNPIEPPRLVCTDKDRQDTFKGFA